MVAYHNDRELKERLPAEMTEHSQAIIHGRASSDWGAEYERYETDYGIPERLTRLAEAIIGLPLFLAAIPVGADLSLVWPRFALWLLVDSHNGLKSNKGAGEGVAGIVDDEQLRLIIYRIAGLMAQWISTEVPPMTGRMPEGDAKKILVAARAAKEVWAASPFPLSVMYSERHNQGVAHRATVHAAETVFFVAAAMHDPTATAKAFKAAENASGSARFAGVATEKLLQLLATAPKDRRD